MSFKLNIVAGALITSSFLLASSVPAEEHIRIGFVDMQRALNESAEGKKALDELKNLMDAKKAKLQEEKDFIEKKKDELDKQGLLLNEVTRREREDEIRRLERDHSRRLSDTKEELAREEAKFTGKIRTDLLQVINELGSEKGYILVLEKQFSAILYAPESIDMTDTVIKRYDEWKDR